MYSPPSDPYPPSPPADTTRWQGTTSGKRLPAQNVPAARWAFGMPGQRGELAVGDRLAVGHLPQDLGDGDLELRAPGEVDLDVLERDALAGEIPAHAIGQRVLLRLRARLPSRRKLVVEKPLSVEVELTHSPARNLV